MISQTYDLNLIPSQIPVTIHCSQYDDGSRTFVLNLYEGASAFEIPAGASATFSGVKPDGLGFQYACAITGASQVSVDVALQMTAVAGDCPCKVTVYDTDSNVLGSALCVLDVERHPLQDDTVISDSDIPLVQEAVNWAAQFQPSDFVARNQGVAQAGKVLGIGADGMVTPVQGGGGGSADTVTYDNTSSGLDATNVQDAIDEVDATVDDIDSTVDGLASQVSTLIGDTANYYNITDSADTTVDDADYIPFYDTSASAKKKITWSNIVTKIKSSLANYFGRKFSQSNGKLSLLADNNTVLDTVTISPLASNTSYTDTNSIGATNVQSAVDTLSDKSYGTATLNSTYVSQGSVTFQKVGKVVTVFISDVRFSTQPPDGTSTAFATGLPRASSNMPATAVILLHPWAAAFTRVMRVALAPNSTALNFNYSAISVSTTTSYYSTFSYICE